MSETTDATRTLVEDGPDTILIENLLLPAEIGILDSEKGRRQSVCFSVEIETVAGYRETVQKTGTFVSYADTVFFIQESFHVDQDLNRRRSRVGTVGVAQPV